MEIKIDTQKDSKEEIKKTIKFLQSIVEEESENNSDNKDMFGMFDSEDNNEYKNDEPEDREKIPRVEIFDY